MKTNSARFVRRVGVVAIALAGIASLPPASSAGPAVAAPALAAPGAHGVLTHPTATDPVWTQTSDAHFGAGLRTALAIAGVGDAAALQLERATLTARRPLALLNVSPDDLTAAPVPIELNGVTFDFAQARSDGADLRVLDADGTTLLPFWIESWNAATEQARLWVRLPALAAGASRTLYLAYGAATAGPGGGFDGTFAKNTVDDGLLARYALDDGYGATVADRATGTHPGTLVNGPVWQLADGGRWGRRADVGFATGSHLQFDGTNDYVEIPVHADFAIDQLTVAAWIQPNASTAAGYRPILAKQNLPTDGTQDFVFMTNDSNGDVAYQVAVNYPEAAAVGDITGDLADAIATVGTQPAPTAPGP